MLNDWQFPDIQRFPPTFEGSASCQCSPASHNPAGLPQVCATARLRKEQQNWPTIETEHHHCKSRNINYYTNQNNNIACRKTSTSKSNLKKLKKSLILTSSPATTSSTVTNDCVKFIRTISSRLNRGILNSRITPCSLAISLGHKKAAHTAPSGVLSAIIEDDKMQKRNAELKKRAETRQNVKFDFQAPPMLVQNFRRQQISR